MKRFFASLLVFGLALTAGAVEKGAAVGERLTQELAKADHVVLKDLLDGNVDVLLRKGFKQAGPASVTLKEFHKGPGRTDYTFQYSTIYTRSCRQIPACASEATVVEVTGVAMFNENDTLGYVIPQSVLSHFSRSFYKKFGGGASVGGR